MKTIGSQLWAFLRHHWQTIVPWLVGLAFLWRIRREEIVRTRLKLAVDVYEAFAHVDLEVQIWVRDRGNVVGADQRFIEEHDKVMREAVGAFHRAETLLTPRLAARLEQLLIRLEQLKWVHRNIAIMETLPPDQRAVLEKPRREADMLWTALRDEIHAGTTALLEELDMVLHGRTGALLRRRSRTRVRTKTERIRGGLRELIEKDDARPESS